MKRITCIFATLLAFVFVSNIAFGGGVFSKINRERKRVQNQVEKEADNVGHGLENGVKNGWEKVEDEGGNFLHKIENETSNGWDNFEKGAGIIAHQIEAETDRGWHKIERETSNFFEEIGSWFECDEEESVEDYGVDCDTAEACRSLSFYNPDISFEQCIKAQKEGGDDIQMEVKIRVINELPIPIVVTLGKTDNLTTTGATHSFKLEGKSDIPTKNKGRIMLPVDVKSKIVSVYIPEDRKICDMNGIPLTKECWRKVGSANFELPLDMVVDYDTTTQEFTFNYSRGRIIDNENIARN